MTRQDIRLAGSLLTVVLAASLNWADEPADDSPAGETNAIQRQYVERAKLTESEERTVIQLANKRGIEKVATIRTYNLYPTAARGIQVEGADQVKGRDVSRQVLDVRYSKWWHPNQGPKPDDLRIGEFWAGKPRVQKQTILKVGGKEYRTSPFQGLTIEEAESLLGRFLNEKYALAPGVDADSLEQVDWTSPMGFRKSGETYSVSFPHKRDGEGFFDLQVRPEGDRLTVTEVLRAIP